MDPNSKPQKFFKKNPGMEKSKKIDPNHKSSLKKIQKWKKIEVLLDPKSRPQKFFKKFTFYQKNLFIQIMNLSFVKCQIDFHAIL